MAILLKSTSKGQVTLPAKWRKKFATDRYLLKETGDSLLITPLDVEALADEKWDVIFDSEKDNDGKGVSIDALIKALKKTL